MDNKSYRIELIENSRKPPESCNKQKNNERKSDSLLLVLFLAIVIGVLASPDLINIRDYIPPDYYESLGTGNTN